MTTRIIHPPRIIDLLTATQEMSRAAHRCRDRAAQWHARAAKLPKLIRPNSQRADARGCWPAWTSIRADRLFARATKAKSEKEKYYELKDRGIVALHHEGVLRYVGSSPQGMAVYEFGEGGKACLHSCLYPASADRTSCQDHPEKLLVAAKKQRFRICDAEFTLRRLTIPMECGQVIGYERSAPPRITRDLPTCWNCGEAGHLARDYSND